MTVPGNSHYKVQPGMHHGYYFVTDGTVFYETMDRDVAQDLCDRLNWAYATGLAAGRAEAPEAHCFICDVPVSRGCDCVPASVTDYAQELPDYGDLMTIAEWNEAVTCGALTDDDGSGNLVKDGRMSRVCVYPSTMDLRDATHVMWFNK